MEMRPERQNNPRAIAREWFIGSIVLAAVDGFAIGNTISLAKYGVPPAAPVMELILLGGAIFCFDRFLQARQQTRRNRENI